MADRGDEILIDTILYLFHKRKTAFLTSETILKELRFQKEVFPKEDMERLEGLLESMREGRLVTLNQPRFAALTPSGKRKADSLPAARIGEIEKDMEERRK